MKQTADPGLTRRESVAAAAVLEPRPPLPSARAQSPGMDDANVKP